VHVNKRPLIASLAVVLVVVMTASIFIALGNRPNLGLDLQGGISAIYTPQLPDGEPLPDDFEDILDETIEVIRTRVDSLGVAEPDISRSGTDVLVQLPGRLRRRPAA
jgi:preprotein translocase subunit SecD